jgi:hypothetical protein
MATNGDTPARCTWLTMTYMDAAGTIRVIEIPPGNEIQVKIEKISPDPHYSAGVEADLLAVPARRLSAWIDHGVKVTIDAHRSAHSNGDIIRVYGRP